METKEKTTISIKLQEYNDKLKQKQERLKEIAEKIENYYISKKDNT